MLDPSHPVAKLLEEDTRYAFEAYAFVFEALNYGQNVLGMGIEQPSTKSGKGRHKGEPETPKHVSGGQLCEAVRQLAVEQFGYMAKQVLNNWGVHSTGDLGEMVFNLIRVGQMRKTAQDKREDFDDIYDFDTAFCQEFKITRSE